MDSSVITVRVNAAEKKALSEYAKALGISLSEFTRKALIDRYEDELDAKIGDEAFEEYLANPVTYTQDEIEDMYL